MCHASSHCSLPPVPPPQEQSPGSERAIASQKYKRVGALAGRRVKGAKECHFFGTANARRNGPEAFPQGMGAWVQL